MALLSFSLSVEGVGFLFLFEAVPLNVVFGPYPMSSDGRGAVVGLDFSELRNELWNGGGSPYVRLFFLRLLVKDRLVQDLGGLPGLHAVRREWGSFFPT